MGYLLVAGTETLPEAEAEAILSRVEIWPQEDGGILRFDPAGHIYSYAGPGEGIFRQVPSITTIIRPMNDEHYGLGNGVGPNQALNHAAERGQAVHEACWYFDQDDLDEDSLDEEIKPYVAAYRKFREESNIEIVEIETPRVGFHGKIAFAGRPDRIVRMKVRRGWSQNSPLDIKTTVDMAPAVGVQLAGYAELLGPAHGGRNLFGLQLKADGSYRLHEYQADHLRYRNHFHALLAHHTYMKEYRK